MFGEAKTVQLDENSSWNWSGEVHFTRTKKEVLLSQTGIFHDVKYSNIREET